MGRKVFKMKNHTTIAFVLDKSSSMNSVTDDTIGGFNKFLKEQREAPGEADLSLYQFGHLYEVSYETVPVKDVKELSYASYNPNGYSTALLDAIGRTIVGLGQRLSSLPESERPDKVVVVIQTDGHENSSREFTADRIKEMITHQEKEYSWEFIYLGATLDAVSIATTMGFKGGSAAAYSGANTSKAFSLVGAKLASYRGMSADDIAEVKTSGLFTEEDRMELS